MSTATTATTASASASDARRLASAEAASVLSNVLTALTPKQHGGTASAIERKNARVLLIIAYAQLLQAQPSPMAAFCIHLSDGSSLPFKVWASRVLGVDVGGRAYAVACVAR